MICFLALALHRVMHLRMKARKHDASPRTSLDLLSRIRKNIGDRTFNGTSRTTRE